MFRSVQFFIALFFLIVTVKAAISFKPANLPVTSITFFLPAPCDRVADSLALVSLYQTTAGFNWTNTWDLNQPMDSWYGITLNAEGCVARVVLELNGLNGNLPAALGNLTQITELSLGNNINLVGALPASITNLTTLEKLKIGGCNLNGNIPADIGNLSALTELNLRSNQLQGSLPASIGDLTQLQTIDLGNNGLTGSLPPEIGQLENLFFLYLDNNSFSGSIPSALGNCSNLIRLWLDDNSLTGNIPNSFGNLTMLQVLWLSKNNLSGPVPDSFQNMSSLNHLEIQFNHLNYLPDLTMLPLENQVNKLRIQENNFTFDDILPNFGQTLGVFYNPQDTVGEIATINACTDERITIDLAIDSGIVNNKYEWAKDGAPYGSYTTLTGNPTLVFQNVTPADAGVYTCRITNPNAPLLELYSYPVTINVSCCDINAQLNPVLCAGETLTINGNTYGEPPSFPASGIEVVSNATSCGADSIVLIALSFFPEASSMLDTIICAGEDITVNGQVYNLSNPSGEEILEGASQNGCDSIIQVSLSFYPPVQDTFSTVLCAGGSININGTLYDEGNTQGTEIFPGATVNGCDSIVFVQLSFEDSIITLLQSTLCVGDTIMVNGNAYYAGNETGTELMSSQQGCDSIIEVSLTFYPVSNDTVVESICAGSSWLFGGVLINQTGFYRDTLLSVNGCDSFINLDLTVLDSAYTNISEAICEGDSLFFGGQYLKNDGIYFDNLFTTAGCDSTVQLTLTVLSSPITQLNTTICAGSFVVFGGDTLYQSGIYEEILQASSGCDSLVLMDIEVLDTFLTNLAVSICQGESYDFLGQLITTAGTYQDTLPAVNGCDSVLLLQLKVLPVYEFNSTATICENEFFVFLGDTLVESGLYIDTLLTQSGCDSILTLELTVLDTFVTNLSESLCAGNCLIFGMDTICESGQYTRNLTSITGCDSTVVLNMTVLDTFKTVIDTSFCAGDFLDFFGQTIIQGGIYQQVLSASNGCDSTVEWQVGVRDTFRTVLSASICANEQFLFFGNELNQSGIYKEVLTAQNGCDSILELQLEVLDTFYTSLDAAICAGEIFDFLGKSLAASGIYLDTLEAINGCDSILELHLIVHDTFHTHLNQVQCQGEIYSFFGNNLSQSGVYYDTLTTQNGCDSIFILNLEVLDTFRTDLDMVICEGELVDFYGTPIFQTGTYRDTLTAQNGCDSIIQLELTVLDTFRSIQNLILCAGEVFDFAGTPVSQEGVYIDTLQTQSGCDSILELHLSVLDTFRTIVPQTICAGDSIVFNQMWLSLPGFYMDTLPANNGCDSVLVLNLSVLDTSVSSLNLEVCAGESILVNGNAYAQTGQYRELVQNGAQNGCDSIINFSLTVTDAATFGYADAGPDITACEDSVFITGTLYDDVTGKWALLAPSQAVIENENNAVTIIKELRPGEQQVIWSLSTVDCPDYDSDTLGIFFEQSPNAFNDLIQLDPNISPVTFSLTGNDFFSNVSFWELFIVSQPNYGGLSLDVNEMLTYSFNTPLPPGTIRFKYALCNGDCPELCDTALVFIEAAPISEPKDSIFIPNTITPNGDGLNDVFEIGNLANLQSKYPKNEMIIFNRWGDIVYKQSPYVTPWNGSENNNGNTLPEGTYYYVFRLDSRQGKIYRGDITIMR